MSPNIEAFFQWKQAELFQQIWEDCPGIFPLKFKLKMWLKRSLLFKHVDKNYWSVIIYWSVTGNCSLDLWPRCWNGTHHFIKENICKVTFNTLMQDKGVDPHQVTWQMVPDKVIPVSTKLLRQHITCHFSVVLWIRHPVWKKRRNI